MKSLIFLLLPGLLLFSCSSAPDKKPLDSEKTAEQVDISLSDEQLVKSYEAFVSAIDTSKAESVSLAADKFREMFDQSTPEVCDKAFVSFERFYAKVLSSIEEGVWKDPKLAEVYCPNVDENGNELPMDKNLRKFLDKVEKHGFRLQCFEGGPGIDMDRKFVKAKFYSMVTPAMKSYMDQVELQNEEWLGYDAGIVLTNTEFVDRTVFWEKFIAANPGFPLLKEAKYEYKNYLTYLLIGMDNTPVFAESSGSGLLDFQVAQGLDEYYDEAYTYLNKKYPTSETNKLVKPYFEAARAEDPVKLTKLLQTYLKQGKLLDFESEFGYEN